MANPNPTPNKDIVKLGEATQFGKGTHPNAHVENGGNKAWSVRNAVRRILAQSFPKPAPGEKVDFEFFKKYVFEGREPSFAEMTALRRVVEAIKGDAKFSQYVTEDGDGKLVQAVVQAPVTLAEIVTGSYKLEQEKDE